MCGLHFEWQKDNGEEMLHCYSSYLLTDNLENPPEYAVPTLYQERKQQSLDLKGTSAKIIPLYVYCLRYRVI